MNSVQIVGAFFILSIVGTGFWGIVGISAFFVEQGAYERTVGALLAGVCLILCTMGVIVVRRILQRTV